MIFSALRFLYRQDSFSIMQNKAGWIKIKITIAQFKYIRFCGPIYTIH